MATAIPVPALAQPPERPGTQADSNSLGAWLTHPGHVALLAATTATVRAISHLIQHSSGQLTSPSYVGHLLAATLLTAVWAHTRSRGGPKQTEAPAIGQYTLESKLGEGAMGVVYRASHTMLRRPTAIKLLRPDRTSPRSLARFEREVRLTASLTHPNTVTVFDYGRTRDGVFYYAMELLDGPTLTAIVEETGPLPPARVIHILSQACAALREAHTAGLVHRDIKPSNIMMVPQGGVHDTVKLLDFGLVKELDSTTAPSVTGTDTVIGTPQYIAPETIETPWATDARSDLYALGAVGYFLLTAHHVFSGATAIELCSEHLYGIPVTPSERLGSAISCDLEAVLMRCLAKDPLARPQSAAQLMELLQGCDDATDWTEPTAARWWETHGTIGQLARRTETTATTGTLDVDLAFRTG